MSGRTIWERELKRPKSGPVHWLTMYVFFVVAVGFALWLVLGVTSPTVPDLASGKVYEVPGGRGSPPFYVDRIDAYALRLAAAHLGVGLLVAGAVGIWNAGARIPAKPT
jgi:hypothetical protein